MNEFNPTIAYNELEFLPPDVSKIETIEILRNENKAIAAISELKGIANIIPNQSILINAIVLQEAKDSSEIENIMTTRDELYKAVSVSSKKIDAATNLHISPALSKGVNISFPTRKIHKIDFLKAERIIS